MSVEACAALVERGDPERFRSAMTAPAGGPRNGLMALYAFNLEVARAAYVASEPMLGEIRLRWWTDAIGEIYAGGAARRHEVCAPLAEAIRAGGLPQAPFDALIAARSWDCEREGFADFAARMGYLEATAAGLMWLAARSLGAPDAVEASLRDLGRAGGAAAFLRAAPALAAFGRMPFAGEADVRVLAETGLVWLARARAGRPGAPRGVLPALLPAATAGAVLREAAGRPGAALAGELEPSEFARRAAALRMGLTGRW